VGRLATDDLSLGTDLVIVSNGTHSPQRAEICEGDPELADLELPCEFRVDRDFGYLLQSKFEAVGQVSKETSQLKSFLKNLPAHQSFFNILPGKYDPATNTTPMTAFALLNTDIVPDFANVSTFRGLSLEQLRDDPRLRTIAQDIAAVISPSCPQGLVADSLRVSVLPVRVTVAARVCGHVGALPVVLVGDAAMGLPLEKGLNYGWKLTNHLCNLLRFLPIKEALKGYSALFDQISTRAVDHVARDYQAFQDVVRKASLVRAVVQKAAGGLIPSSADEKKVVE
jgi:hypothetical protein